jgi:hypothetical protein
MPTNSFTREIRITEPSAIKKIKNAMKVITTDNFRTSINNVDEMLSSSRKALANRITQKY